MRQLMKKLLSLLLLCAMGLMQSAFDIHPSAMQPQPQGPVTPRLVSPYLHDRACQLWVDSVMKRLSLKEKVGQLFIYTIAPQRDKANRNLLHKVIKEYHVGGLLFSGGHLADQAILMNEAQQLSKVPLLMTFDGEWGLAMRMKELPAFPKNMILGCIRDDSLLYAYGREVARQCRELGVQVNFAPVADVNINPKNPVINVRSFGADPESVSQKVIAYARGLEDGGVLSVCKHFPGHGDTEVDSHKALPRLTFDRARLDSIELYPFKNAIAAGLGGVMVGHLEVPVLESKKGVPASLSHAVVTDLLTNELQFKGLIFTDALAMKGVQVGQTACLKALKAGHDQLLVPRRIKEEVDNVMNAIKSGELSEQTIDERCRKVLTYKYALGLKKRPHIQLSGLEQRINTAASRELIARLYQSAITVVGNQNGVLPLDVQQSATALLYVGSQSTVQSLVEHLPQEANITLLSLPLNATPQQVKQLRDKLNTYSRLLIAVTDQSVTPYQILFEHFLPAMPTVWLSFVDNKKLTALQQAMAKGSASVLAHTAIEDVQRFVAQLLYGKAAANGRLSAPIGTLYALGDGVDIGPQTPPHYLPGEYGLPPLLAENLERIAQEGVDKGAYTGCQVVVMKQGKMVVNRAFGTVAGKGSEAVKTSHLFDLASLTKTSATLLAVMKLYDMGRLNLSDRLGDLLPWLAGTDKRAITIKELLLHESGLPPSILFYQEAIDNESYQGSLYRAVRDRQHPVQIGSKTWANPNFRYKEGLTFVHQTNRHTLQVADSLWIDASFKEEYRRLLAEVKLGAKRYRYSCVGFIMLQQVVEAISEMPLDRFVATHFYEPMGLKHTGYLPLKRVKKEQVVPSNRDNFLRQCTLQGFVHDESAAFQGGVSGNAGLFSTAGEVAQIYQMILNGGTYQGKRYLSETTCRLFTTTTSKISRRGLGFDKPDMRNVAHSPCGERVPASVYGHTGFTGTCAWVDPDNQMIFVFLSNRTYPRAWNPLFSRLRIRHRLQEALYQ